MSNKTKLGILPNDIYSKIYKILFNETLIELKNTLNGIYTVNYTMINRNKHFINLYNTLVDKIPYELFVLENIYYNYDNYDIVYYNIQLFSYWEINIKSFQNHHIYNNAKIMKYVNFRNFYEEFNKFPIYTDIKGNCWQDIYEAADELIKLSNDHEYNSIIDFKIVDKYIIELITSI